MSEESLKLENQLCFPLYAAAREVIKQYKPHLDAVGLTYTQYVTMMVVWEHKHLNIKEIGKKLHLDSGTLTPLLKKLEKSGFIRRTRNAHDERNVSVELTSLGEELKHLAAPIPQKIGACIPLSSEEAATLYTLLYKLMQNTTV